MSALTLEALRPRHELPRQRLGIALDTMWSVKDYLLSGALRSLAEAFRIVAWVPQPLLADSRALLRDIGLEDVELRAAVPYKASAMLNAVCALQKALLFERFDVDTERVMRTRQASASVRARSALRRFASRPIRLISKTALAPRLDAPLDAVRRGLTPTRVYRDELNRLGLDGILLTDPVRREFDGLYYEAKRLDLPVATLVLSWDNITAKGRIHAAYDRILVWNEAMRDEVLHLYPSFNARHVIAVGFPRFNVYRQALPEKFERTNFLTSLGLDPGSPVVLFANGATRSFGTQPEVIQHICGALGNGELPPQTQLLIRCHPHDDIAVYEHFRKHPRVAVWPSRDRVREATLFEQTPHADELLILAASIRHSSVCVNPGSTVMLDAALADVPIVCVAYDGDQQLPYWQSFRSCYEYSHQKAFHRQGATEVCFSREELLAAIGRSIEDPGRKAPQRAQVADFYLGGTRRSIPRVREALCGMMSEHGARVRTGIA